jgi:hypothetical protein
MAESMHSALSKYFIRPILQFHVQDLHVIPVRLAESMHRVLSLHFPQIFHKHDFNIHSSKASSVIGTSTLSEPELHCYERLA